MRRTLLALALLLALGGAATWWLVVRDQAGQAGLHLRTDVVERGEVVLAVDASGTIQPLLLVQVGTQVSGTIETLYKDWNARVSAGEAIAVLDSRRLVAQVLQGEANLGRARAEVEHAAALMWQTERALVRQEVLAARGTVSETLLDAARTEAVSARAGLAVTAAAVSQALAQLDGDRVNLAYATIRSPIDGVIVARNVDVGQTVAASLQAPTLFLIANDLTRIQVQASVPEADVGKVHEGQRVEFDVDAHPDRRFQGLVSQVRLAATTVQNVVTYTVLVDARNPDGLLLPGMTANARFELARSPATGLRVPVSAVRFQPPDELREAGAPAGPEALEGPEGRPGRVWVPGAAGRLRAVPVVLGVSDGAAIAVAPLEPGALTEGAEVVIGVEAEDAAQAANPFLPRIGGPRR